MIVWLASYPKSGNTWLRKFLQAYVLGPPFRLNDQHPRFRGDLSAIDYQAVSNFPITQLSIPDHLFLRTAVLWNLAMTVHGPLYLKTHHSLTSQLRIEMIPLGITDRAIYIVRDPRDVVPSYAHHFGVSLDEAVTHINSPTNTIHDPEQPALAHGIGEWAGHVNLWKNREYPINRVIVRYEDMLRKPHSTFRHILKFLELEEDQDRFNWAVTATRFKNLQAQEDKQGFAERSKKNGQFFRQGRANAWQEVLTDAQVSRIESVNGEMMKEMGYALHTQA